MDLASSESTDDSKEVQSPKRSELHKRLIKTELKGNEQVPLAVYYLAVAALGIPVAISVLMTRPLPAPGTAFLLGVLGLVSYHLPVVLPTNVQMNPGFPLLMSALFCHGASAAIIVLIPSSLLHFVTRKHGLANCLFNAGQFSLCTLAAELVGHWAGWVQGTPATNSALFPIILMLVTYDITNTLFLCVSIRIDTKRPLKECFVKMFYEHRKAVLPLRTFLTLVAILLSSHMGNMALVLVFFGVLTLRGQNTFQRELVIRTEQAETDTLTKAHNLRYLDKWIDTEFPRLAKRKNSCSFIFLDVDELKIVNDTYGHNAGDSLLIHLAGILSANIRSEDHVTRYGGDEFIVACPGTSLHQAEAIARRILGAFRMNPFCYAGVEVELGLSVGVACWPDHGETATDVIRMADKAMYVAKKSGGNAVRTAEDL